MRLKWVDFHNYSIVLPFTIFFQTVSQAQLAEVYAQVNALRHQYEESKAKETQLKALNKVGI